MTAPARGGITMSLAAASLAAAAPPAGTAPADSPCAGLRCPGELVYFGTQASTAGQGIYAARFDPRTGVLNQPVLVAELLRPTWLQPHPRLAVLYAVSETGNDGKSPSRVVAYRIDRRSGALSEIGHAASGGSGATHLALDRRADTLFVANFGSGTVAALPLDRQGIPGEPASIQANSGSGPRPRQAGPHAHAVVPDPSGRFLVVPDLGADRLFTYRFDARQRALAPADPAFVTVPPAGAPRHALFGRDGRFLYLIDEFRPEIVTWHWDARAGRLSRPMAKPLFADDEEDRNKGGEIMASPDGRFLYATLRGPDLVVVEAIDRATGSLHEVQRLASGGQTPWALGLHPGGRWLLVANQGSGTVAVFRRDPASGRLTPGGNAVPLFKPTSIVFPAVASGQATGTP